MPEFLEPDRVSLSISDGAPTLTLQDVDVSSTEGWSFLNRATLLVVDGPGDEGFLLRRLTQQGDDAAPEGWDEAVASRGSVTVQVSGAAFDAPVIGPGTDAP